MDALTQIHPILPGFSCAVFSAQAGVPADQTPVHKAMVAGYQDIYIINLDFKLKPTTTSTNSTASTVAAPPVPGLIKRVMLASGKPGTYRFVQFPVDNLPATVQVPPLTQLTGAPLTAPLASAAPKKLEFTQERPSYNFLPDGKVPVQLLDQVKAFFKAVIKKHGTKLEAMIWVLWHPERGYYLHVPTQSVGGASASYDWSDLPADGSLLVVDIHSHADFSAFFSGTDDRDDSGSVRISGVLGFNDTPEDKPVSGRREIWRFNCYGTKIDLQMSDVFFTPPRPVEETPEAWMSKVSLHATAPALVATGGTGSYYPYMGHGASGGYGGRVGSSYHRPPYNGSSNMKRGHEKKGGRNRQRQQQFDLVEEGSGLVEEMNLTELTQAYIEFRRQVGTPILPGTDAWNEIWENGPPPAWDFSGAGMDVGGKGITSSGSSSLEDLEAGFRRSIKAISEPLDRQVQSPAHAPANHGPSNNVRGLRTLGPAARDEMIKDLVASASDPKTAEWIGVPEDFDEVVCNHGVEAGNIYAVVTYLANQGKVRGEVRSTMSTEAVIDALLPEAEVLSLSQTSITDLVVGLARALPPELVAKVRESYQKA